MEQLTQKLTPKEVYDYYINQPSTQETFTLFYTRKYKDGVEMKGQKFESKDETYCISLIESIMDSEDFLGWPFGDTFTPYDISEWDVTLTDGLEEQEYIMKETKFKVGDKAIKTKGYEFPCTIVSVFETVQGNVRVVGEMDGYGLLHIFNEDQLEKVD